MVKRLNFYKSETMTHLDDELDLELGYKDALDYAITKALTPTNLIPPGPYMGTILRAEKIGSTDTPPIDRIISKLYGLTADTTTKAEAPAPFSSYKVRIPELDACIPEPPDLVSSPGTNSEANIYIELHTTFQCKESLGILSPGQLVWVNFGDHRTREEPFIVEPYFKDGGEIYIPATTNTVEGAKATFNKCKSAKVGGAPDGSSLSGRFNMLTDGAKNFVLRDDRTIKQGEVESLNPKNTFPRECSTSTEQRESNKPDNKEEEDNLTYMEEEVIPRLWPALLEVDSRFIVTSVYRSDAVNKAVGGSPTSWHAEGLGVDFGGLSKLSPSDRNEIFFKAVNHLKSNRSKFPFLRTVIVETFRNHIHIDVYPKGSKGSCRWRKWNNKGAKMEKIT
tara:strand:+ start:1504 stop:2682 length:1179 start_codon:yes stop_codon:yes gene_type:complete